MEIRLGELVPLWEHFFFYVEEHAKKGLVDCWQKIPLRHPGIRFEVSMRLFFVPVRKQWSAQIETSNLPEESGECMVRALSGLELPDYYGPGPYELTLHGYRGTDEGYYSDSDSDSAGPAHSPDRFPWVGLSVASAAIVASGLLIRRRFRKRTSPMKP